MPSAKVTVAIPASLGLSAEDKAKLKQVFNTEVVRVLKKYGKVVGSDITNVKNGPRKGSSRKKAGKKASKKA